jgi:hypothetical protein
MNEGEQSPVQGGEGGALKGIFICAAIGCGGWLALNAGTSDLRTPLVAKQDQAPPSGVIGGEDRVPLAEFTPDGAERFPGWENAAAAVVRISCNGGATGGGVLIGDGDRMLTAAHVFLENSGQFREYRASCNAIHTSGDVVPFSGRTLKAGPFAVPEALGDHFSVTITQNDWAIVTLSRAPTGAVPLPLAAVENLTLEDGAPVMNITGATDNYATDGFLAQTCAYRGPPPSASALNDAGEIFGRPFEEADRLLVARYDCDIGAGGSGSPVIGWHEGRAYVWGIMTDSLRGRDRCPDVGETYCYTAGPLTPAMDVVP